jgi:uncharacterized protein (TIGR02722 family)
MLAAGIICLNGCAAFRIKVTEGDVDKKRHLDSTYDYTDMREITESVVDEMLTADFVKGGDKPIMMIADVQNRTKRHVDTKSLTDRMRTMLFKSGQVQFVNETRRKELLKEQKYQADQATPETQVAIARQIGAKYMVSGSLVEMEKESGRQIRVSRTEVNYYKLTIEVTDLESGLLKWTTEKEFVREARKPLIGW